MNWLEFISSMVGHLGWPVAFVIGVLILRKPLQTLLPSLTKAKIGNTEWSFGGDIGDAEFNHEVVSDPAELARLFQYLLDGFDHRTISTDIRAMPLRILKVWSRVESLLLRWARSRDLDHSVDTVEHALRIVKLHDVLDESDLREIEQLREIRNSLVHGEDIAVDGVFVFTVKDLPTKINQKLFPVELNI